MMSSIEREFREGSKEQQEVARSLAQYLKDHEDIDLPQQSQLEKEIAPDGVKRFSDETRELLTKDSYRIYVLAGHSVRTFREAKRPIWEPLTKDGKHIAFENKDSMVSEVALNPSAIFLPESNNITLEQQNELIAKFSNDLSKKMLGVEAVIGEAADYVGLVFAHLDATGEKLFSGRDLSYARTKTPTFDSYFAGVGYYFNDSGLRIDTMVDDQPHTRSHVFPLIKPQA